jgi:hypothetical protein
MEKNSINIVLTIFIFDKVLCAVTIKIKNVKTRRMVAPTMDSLNTTSQTPTTHHSPS